MKEMKRGNERLSAVPINALQWPCDKLRVVFLGVLQRYPVKRINDRNTNTSKPNTYGLALAGVAQWVERHPVNRKVTGSIPDHGTCLGYGPGLGWGASKRQPIDISLAH